MEYYFKFKVLELTELIILRSLLEEEIEFKYPEHIMLESGSEWAE